MLKNLIGATLLTMGVGVSTPTPNFIRADNVQNTTETYETNEYVLEQMLDSYDIGFAIDKWTTYLNNDPDNTTAIADDKISVYNDDDDYYIQGYYGTITEDQYNTAINETSWNNESNWENTSLIAFKVNGDVVKSNATINISYQSTIKYYACKWLSRISVYTTTSNVLDELLEQAINESYFTGIASNLAYELDMKSHQYNSVTRVQNQDYGTYGIINTGNQLIWPNPSLKEQELNITLSYNLTTTVFVILQNFYVETTTTEYGYIKSNQTSLANDGLLFSYLDSVNLNYFVPSGSVSYEYIDIPRIMFNILTMPFAFMSEAFNLTIFPGTAYAINISNLFLAIIGIAVFIFILKKVLK